jgi:hypothetical protein
MAGSGGMLGEDFTCIQDDFQLKCTDKDVMCPG